jgi:hypothetical protein
MITNSKNKTFLAGSDGLRELGKAYMEARSTLPDTHSKPPLFRPSGIATPVCGNTIPLSEPTENFSDMMWKIIEIIGKSGFSRYLDIEWVLKVYEPDFIRARVLKAAQDLVNMGVLHNEIVSIPLRSKFNVFSLTNHGSLVFRKQFGVKPVESEIARVKRAHHNLKHGYSILDIQRILISSGRYKEVCAFNRKNDKNAGAVHNYIPDLLCVPINGNYQEYIEYVRGTLTKHDIIQKCIKIRKTTTYLNFIVENKPIMEKRIIPKLEAWISTFGSKGPTNTIIRLTTPKKLRDNNGGDNAWQVLFNSKN